MIQEWGLFAGEIARVQKEYEAEISLAIEKAYSSYMEDPKFRYRAKALFRIMESRDSGFTLTTAIESLGVMRHLDEESGRIGRLEI